MSEEQHQEQQHIEPPIVRESERLRVEVQEWKTRAELTQVWALIIGIVLLAGGIAIGLRINDRAFDRGVEVGTKSCGK